MKQEIRPEYLQTIFIAKPPKDGWPERFHIITACNPYSTGKRSGDEAAHTELRKTLSRLRCWKHPIEGASPDWKHREKGFAVAGLELKQAREIGRKFKQRAIFTVADNVVRVIGCRNGSRAKVGKFSERCHEPNEEPRYRIYVIRLDDAVMKVKRFCAANPNYRPGKPCYYVGMTSLTPDERFAQHKAGIKDCRFVRDFGVQLEPSLFEPIPKLSRAAAEIMEKRHAEHLRSLGYGVWQN